MKKRGIGQKVRILLLTTLFLAILLTGIVSMWSLYSMKKISMDINRELGQTAADDAEEALENMAGDQLQKIAIEKASYIEEKFAAIVAYVHGIASQAQDIYENPEKYPNRNIALPQKNGTELAAQLLRSKKLIKPTKEEKRELLKLGNIQDLLVQYNANNEMVSSTYVATASGWMIQADYIAYSKYEENSEEPIFYEADTRQWYQQAQKKAEGEIIYTDVIVDVHEGKDCIVCAQPIYCDGKIVAVAGVGSYLETVNAAVLDTTIGKNGYAFLVNEKGQVMVSGRTEGETAAYAEKNVDLRESANRELAVLAKNMVAKKTGIKKLTVDDREVYLAFAPLKNLGWSFVTIIDVAEVIEPARKSQEMILQLTEDVAMRQDAAIQRTLLFFGLAIILAVGFISIISMIVTKKITDPIRKLTMDVAQIDGGNLDYRIDIATGDEVEDLGNAFNSMTAQIQQYIGNLASITAEKERIRTEIQVASQLQADMLPDGQHAFKDRKEFSLYASMTPAKGVGGDFYDFFLLDEDHLAFLVADVSGKGVPAALFMVVSKTLLRSYISKAVSLEQAVREVNEELCRNNKNGMFVTAWMGVLTISTGMLTFVNAGHCRPLLKQGKKEYAYMTERSGFVLAGMEDIRYKQGEIQLMPGDVIFLYSDGVTEANDSMGRLYGEPRLEHLLKEKHILKPEQLVATVWEDIEQFQGKAEQFDDITMLAFRYYGDGFVKNTGEPSLNRLEEVTKFIEENLEESAFSKSSITKLLVAVDEIFSNICYYSEATQVTIGCKIIGKTAQIYFEDNGISYNPLKKPEPDIGLRMEERKEGGLGIYLVKKSMDEVIYKQVNGKNHLMLIKEDKISEA